MSAKEPSEEAKLPAEDHEALRELGWGGFVYSDRGRNALPRFGVGSDLYVTEVTVAGERLVGMSDGRDRGLSAARELVVDLEAQR